MKKLLFLPIVGLLTSTAHTQNVPAEITTSRPIATGPNVVGIFEGRCPCKELATLLKVSLSGECFKTKWKLTLLQDPATQQPSTYELDGSFYRNNLRKGSWQVIKGIKNDPNTIVYQLNTENSDVPFFLLKGDDNVLFMLDQEKNVLVGNELFSYTLNRVEKKTKTLTTTAALSNPTHYKWEQVLPFGNGSFPEKWKPGTFPLGIVPRIAFDGDLWMIGQKAAWSSTDGVHWTQHKKTDLGERIWSSQIYFNNKFWLLGGMKYQEKQVVNDVWFSADGLKWEQVKNLEWSPRKGHTVIAFQNKLWLFGGVSDVLPDFTSNNYLNDAWSSKDGLHWTREATTMPWPPRDNPNLIVFKDALYMLGGQGKADIWRSTDGKNWNQLTLEAAWKNRHDNGLLVFDDKLWVFGGRDTTTNHNTGAKNDVWYSEDGMNWNQQTEHAPWTVRSGGTSVVFKNKLWLFSGKHTGGKYNWGGDVWTMDK